MIINFQTETCFFYLSCALVAAGLTGFDLLVILEFAVINKLCYRRFGMRRNLDKVKVCFAGKIERYRCFNNTDLFILRSNETHFRSTNLIIYTLFADDDSISYCSV